MIPEIIEYLQQPNPDFDSGFALFCKYSPSLSLMKWIGRKRDPSILQYELQKLGDYGTPKVNAAAAVNVSLFNRPAVAAPAITQEPPAPAEESATGLRFRTIDERRTRRSDLPEELQRVYDDTVA